jgi:hypothetical protein
VELKNCQRVRWAILAGGIPNPKPNPAGVGSLPNPSQESKNQVLKSGKKEITK